MTAAAPQISDSKKGSESGRIGTPSRIASKLAVEVPPLVKPLTLLGDCGFVPERSQHARLRHRNVCRIYVRGLDTI